MKILLLKMHSLALVFMFLPFEGECESAIDSVRSGIVEFASIVRQIPALRKDPVEWPATEIIRKNEIDSADVSRRARDDIDFYQSRFLEREFRLFNETHFLRNMSRGDDWMIGYSYNGDRYSQVIDGRTLNLTAQRPAKQTELPKNAREARRLLSNYVDLEDLAGIGETQVFLVKSDSGYVLGGIIPECFIDESVDKLAHFATSWFAISSEYMFISVSKKRCPDRNSLRYTCLASTFSFTRTNNLPYKWFDEHDESGRLKAALLIYPWLNDSLERVQERLDGTLRLR